MFTFISPSVEPILGFAPKAVIGHNWREFVDETAPENVELVENDRRRFLGGVAQTYSATLKDAWDRIRVVDLHTFGVQGRGGEIENFGIARDITGQENAVRVAEKRATFAEQQLQSQLRMTSKTVGDRSNREFCHALVHELAQPLAVIQSLTESLQRNEEETADFPRCVELLVKATGFATGILCGMRNSLTERDATMESCWLVTLVDAALGMLEHELTKADVDVQVHVPDDALVLVDPIPIQQVFVNLVRNAMEALAEVTVRRRIDIDYRVESGRAELIVSDNGPGVPNREYDLFDIGTSSKEKGMGIGLSICRQIIENHGGQLRYSANSPSGARFLFTLPIPKSDEQRRELSGPSDTEDSGETK